MKIIGFCFDCRKQHDITRVAFGTAVKCECGGTVVSKSGHASIVIDSKEE